MHSRRKRENAQCAKSSATAHDTAPPSEPSAYYVRWLCLQSNTKRRKRSYFHHRHCCVIEQRHKTPL